MAVNIVYPGSVTPVNISGLTDGLDALGKGLEERKTRKALDAYVNSLYDGGREMSLAALAPQQTQGAPVGQVTRAPLPADDYASQRVAQAHAASGGNPPAGAIEAYIRHAAQQRGIDPDTAVKVAMSEGGVTDPTRQSDVVNDGVREQSFGPFQLFMNGGLGNEAMAAGIDPRTDWKGGIDFALDKAKSGGWGPWNGAKAVGITGMEGINGSGNAVAGSGASSGVQMAQSAVGGSPASLLPPREVMQELLRNPETRTLGITIAREAQKARTDPEAALRLEKLRAEIDKLRNPDASAKFGNSVIWGQDADGNWVAMQPSSGGGLIQAQTPEGIKLSPPGASNLNLGTQFAVRDRNGNVINTVPIDNAGKASDTAFGKDQGEARGTFASMSSKLPGLETVVAELDKLAEKATYTTGGQLLDLGRKELGMAPREAAIARTDYMAKVANQILPLLRDTFGAQFTAREGDTLMATLGDPDKTPAEKQAVLRSFIEQKKRDIEALARQTGQATGNRTSSGVQWSIDD